MNLRDFLEQRERELSEQIAAHHAQLAPLEAELAEIRRAKGALGVSSGGMGLGSYVIDSSTISAHNVFRQGRMSDGLAAHLAATSGATEPPLPLRASPYGNLTMKELIVKVLREHFPNGATARQMLVFFRDAWSRSIERQNLSPQISRLFQEGTIGRIPSTKAWFLIPKENVIQGFRPYFFGGQVVWAQPESATPEYEPLETCDGWRQYRVLEKCYHDRLYEPGEVIWLLPHEAGPHHQPIDPEPDQEED
jgi:hypothetical protein